MIQTENFEKLEINSSQDLREWLRKNHNQQDSIWLVTYRKSTPQKYVSVSEVLDELLCFGWIDGIRRKLDEHKTMQLISQRKTQHWTHTYKKRAARLIIEDKMEEPGLHSIQESKDSGLWDFMDDVDQLIIPEDLKTSLSKEYSALEFFEGINDSSKRNALRWLKLAKTEETREKRIAELTRLSKNGERLPGS